MIVDKLCDDLNKYLGIKVNYLADLTHRTVVDDRCISYLVKYIPMFKNIGISLDLIKSQFYRKGNKGMLNPIIENTLDNALSKIQDKNKIPFYLELISENNKFPFVMVMLGKWNIESAKPIIESRLQNDIIKSNAIKALGYYKDKDKV